MSPNDTYPQHVVTAVIVAHDGAAWLPGVIEALLEQTRPVQRVVAVDTGSRDRSGAVLSGLLGQAVVFGMDRGTGYGAAVARALQHRAANLNVPGAAGPPRGERVEWIWLLHDDCEPAPDALEQLLRGAAETRSAAVLGPKVLDLADRQVILEAGVTIDTAGRRITGIEPREVDQGQHDGDRDGLAVGSAGMLVRRDVWEQVGGFDPSMTLFREDVDFCWRVHAAGYRVRVITDAVVYHVEASARRRRPVSATRRPRRQDRRNAMFTLAANLPVVPMLATLAGNVSVSLLRAIFFLMAKRPTAALDELAAVGSVLGHPLSLLRARHRRSRGRRAAYGRLKPNLPPGRSVRRIAEFAAAAMSRSTQVDTAGSHHATEDPADDDFLLTDTGLAQRLLTSPGVLLFLGLTVVALVAERSLIGGGPLGGGALVPAWGGAAGLWHQYLQGFHPAGIGSGSTAPPYLAIVAVLATAAGGKPWLAIDVILLGCVPLAGISAFAAVRQVTRPVLVRVWAAATYALLPVATGAIAAGRIGTAAVFVLIPLIALLGGRMFTQPPRRARRAAWATGLTVAIAAAFVPLTWVIVVAAGAVALAVSSAARSAGLRNLGIVAIVPPVLLIPWTVQVAAHPSAVLLEAGLQQPGLAGRGLPARSLLLLSPGGPGLPPIWITGGLGLAAVIALLLSGRRMLVLAGWGMALLGLLAAITVSRLVIGPAAGGPGGSVWPGVALAIAGAGLLLAAAAAGEAIPRLVAGPRLRGLRTLRGLGVAVLAAAACSAPLLAAGHWVITGASGPVAPVAGPLVPELVTVSSGGGTQLRTLVLRQAGAEVTYALQRGLSPSLGDAELAPVPAAQRALNTAVATLVAPNGGEAVDQGQSLAAFDVGFVLVPAPVNAGLERLLDGVAGLRPVSATAAFDLWRVDDQPARVRVVEPNGTMAALPSGPVTVSGAAAPAAGGTLEVAEPAGGWSATLNGRTLTPVTSPAGTWAQAFRLPPGGGSLDITRQQTGHDLALIAEALAVLVVIGFALPGARSTAGEDGQDDPASGARQAADTAQAQAPGSHGRREIRSRDARVPDRSARRPRQDAGAAPPQRGGRRAAPPKRGAGRRRAEPAARPSAQPGARPAGSRAARPPGPPAPPPSERSAGWPSDDRAEAPSGRSPGWPSDDRAGAPSGRSPGWPVDDRAGAPAGRSPGWPTDDHAAAPPPSRSPGWPGGGGDMLDPLPDADGTGHAWPGSAAGEVPPPSRWPVPDRDAGGDAW